MNHDAVRLKANAAGPLGWFDTMPVLPPAPLERAACLALLAFAAPNTQQLFAPGRIARLAWSPSLRWSMAMSLLFLGCLFSMNWSTEFLYSQF